MMACSKKCKKVAKFAYMPKKNNENEILKTFESMLRKKMQKNLEHASLQSRGLGFKSMMVQGNYKQSNKNMHKTVGDQSQYYAKSRSGHYDVEEEKNLHKTIEDHSRFRYPDMIGEFAWDPDNSSKEITLSSDCRHAFLYETNYYFRTIISNQPFFGGIHYWEIIADARTEHELKIGVTAQQTFNVNSSFSDYEFGFAYYGLGQLRHSDNSLGEPYGKIFKKKGVLGVLLNMNLGTLSFSLDGEYMGVAFEDKILTKGPIWAAVSLLHIGGLTLVSGIEPPSYIPVNDTLHKK